MTTLIVIDQAPYGSWSGREGLDMAFSLAAFDQSCALLFSGAGVNWLRAGQQPDGLGQKSVAQNLGAAAIFGVEALYADTRACQRYGLADDAVIAGITLITPDQAFMTGFENVTFAG
ncbi:MULTISPECIES: DsrE family protein [unclassified Marinobacter]|jgi:tRNA 2-thiouridine synthesizing protein C|uniref:DsrE family protein n=1 Tax=unclassified Marinobacter TaxID=83889 RepID=UPI000BF2D02F|nr:MULTISPECIES: DsrE family protein [unclassified Marinobacter]PFG08867.1 tRNA 2-thiouridine synthesizing protein C [Marinobacter sp. LV10MA510-1]PFG54733.1 tRNA 2-thiouridine synthesizing protein C [Marinobacter sp. LV10R520-4]